MRLKSALRRGVAAAVIAGIVVSSGIPAYAARWDIANGDITVKAGDAEGKNKVSQGETIDKDDTKVLFVNTKDEDGAVDGELQEAAPATGSGYINNALYIVGSGNTLDLLIVDLGNELDTDVFPNP